MSHLQTGTLALQALSDTIPGSAAQFVGGGRDEMW